MSGRVRIFLISIQLLAVAFKIYSQAWTADELYAANPAASCPFLSQVEKDVVLYNNLARMYPRKFIVVELQGMTETSYLRSLKQDLNRLQPLPALLINREETDLARCWAEQSGRIGVTGHNRTGCDDFFLGGYGGENCSYGTRNGRDIIIQLLIDENISNLGHRKNCLSPQFVSVGVATAAHKVYGFCCVMDFTSLDGVAYHPTARQTSSTNESGSKEIPSNSITGSSEQASGTWLKRYCDYSGAKSLSYFSAGYTYSFVDNRHLVCASLLDFRIKMFGLSPLCAEFSVSPVDVRVAYKPTIRLCVPVYKCLALNPYIGVAVDMSYLGSLVNKNYDFNKDRDFYVSAIGGVGLYVTAAKHVPLEVRVEYRHPVVTPSSGAFNSQGIYLAAQIYFGSVFD